MTNITTTMTIAPTTNTTTVTNHAVMTSLKMVDYINSQRGCGEAELRHSTFLVKVPTVLKDQQKFLSIYRDAMNRSQPMYVFPKREACLMAMSYSYKLQAKVFDRMTAMEQHQNAALPAVKAPGSLREALLLALAQEEQIEALNAAKIALESQAALAAPKVDVYDAVVADKLMTVPAFGMLLTGVNTKSMHADLVRMGYLRKTPKGFSTPAPYRDTLFKVSICPTYGKTVVLLLDKGKQEVTRLWKAGMLTMKTSHRAAMKPAARVYLN